MRSQSLRRNVCLLSILFMGLLSSSAFTAQLEFSAPQILNTNALTDGMSDEDSRPTIATDGQGHWVSVWVTPGIIGSEPALLLAVAVSTDNGRTWTDPEPLNPTGSVESEVVLATDGIGNWVVVWVSRDSLGGTIGTDSDLLFSRSIVNGTSWSDPAPLNTNAGSDTQTDEESEPDLATDGKGHWVAVWSSNVTLGDTIGGDADILVSRSSDGGATWTDPAPLNTDAATDPAPPLQPKGDFSVAIDTDRQGRWIATWGFLSASAGGILTSQSTDNGQTWTDPAGITPPALLFVYDPEIATDRNGHWIVVYNRIPLRDHKIFVSLSSDNGANWTVPVTLNTDASTDLSDDGYAKVVTDGQGNRIAFWDNFGQPGDIGGPDRDILAALSTDNGQTWTDPVLLNTNGVSDNLNDDGANMATDGQGHWLAVWSSQDSSLVSGIGQDRDILITEATIREEYVADLNGDGLVNEEDLFLFHPNWQGVAPNLQPSGADIDSDSDADDIDLLLFLDLWHQKD